MRSSAPAHPATLDVLEPIPGTGGTADGTDSRPALPEASGPGHSERNGRLPRIVLRIAVGFVAFMVLGNAAILVASGMARAVQDSRPAPDIDGVDNFAVVDDRVWRGGAPDREGYASLAAHGAATVVDLRAEALDGGDEVDRDHLAALGLDLVELPIRDGQTPTTTEVRWFLDAVEGSRGPVFVHCGAGVGRAGSMVAAYLMATDQADAGERIRHNLAIGPPSLEQIAYAAWVDDDFDRPALPVVAVSRVLDSPRRIWHNLT